MLCKQYMYIYLRFYLFVYSCIECVEIFIFFGGGGCLLKKLIDAYLLRNKKKYKEEKNATVKFYVM